MVSRPFWHQRRALRHQTGWRSRGSVLGVLLYGRALCLLYLPPPPHPLARDHVIVAALRRYQARLHLQRTAVMMARALVLATLAATGVLLLRVFGAAIPLPAGPLAAAGGVLALVLIIALFQRPSAQRVAHALDQRLDLHEQIGSALDIEPGAQGLAARLQQRAAATLQSANVQYVLPWPSLHRERRSLIALALVCALSALLAAHARPARPGTEVALGRGDVARHGGTAPHGRARSAALPMKLLGSRATAGSHPTIAVHRQRPGSSTTSRASGSRASGAQRAQQGGSGGQGRRISSNALTVHTGQTQGRGGTGGSSSSAGPRGATGTRSAAGRTGATGHAGSLHLTAPKNSAAGGVASPQQQEMVNLQNSISAAQAAQNGATQGQQGTNQSAARNGRNGAGAQGRNGAQRNQTGHGRNRTGGSPNGQRNGQGPTNGQNPYSPYGPQSGNVPRNGYGRGGAAGAPNPDGPFRYGGQPGGSATGPRDPFATSTGGVKAGGALLGNGTDVTLNGTPGRNGQLITSLGTPARLPAMNGGSLSGVSSNAIVTVPGYVAPDSNAVAPDDRSAVQGYFSPPPNQ